MNLLHAPWMPVRDGQGRRHWIRPDQLSDPAWRAFDADRPDFNGALAQFAIGLLQTTTPVDNPMDWRRFLHTPPDGDILRQWFEPVAAAFVLDGDGPRFMQDLALSNEPGKPSPIAEILIDAPGESSVDGNKDLFVKRGVVLQMCSDCAALAVLTLQINAPEGGAVTSHRTAWRWSANDLAVSPRQFEPVASALVERNRNHSRLIEPCRLWFASQPRHVPVDRHRRPTATAGRIDNLGAGEPDARVLGHATQSSARL